MQTFNLTEPVAGEKTIRFISGSFTPDEARDLLNSILASKIEFHRIRNFSFEERTGGPHPFSAERILELTAGRKALIDLIRAEAKTGQQVRIESMIQVTITGTPDDQS